MIKVFISQPMNGLSKEEIIKRRANLINDLEFNRGDVSIIQSVYHDDFSKSKNASVKYLAKAINDLAEADIAVFANGWENARGCRIEHEIALRYGIKVLHETEGENNGR